MAMSKEKRDFLKKEIAMINKNLKTNVGFASDQMEHLRIKYIKTPSLVVNTMLGGGFPRGRIVELFGESGSGKTTLAIETIAYNMKQDPNFIAAWCETEGSVDDMTLWMYGIDPERLIFWKQEENAEQAMEVLRALIQHKEIDMVVVNSVAGLCPTAEIEKDLVESNVALTARLMSRLMRIITGPTNKNDTLVLFINQLRSTIAANKYAEQSTTTGGAALKYYSTQRIAMRRGSIDEKTSPIKREEGIRVCLRVHKNRVAKGNPYVVGEYHAIYGKGIQSIFELPDLLVEQGILRKAGSWHYWDDENGEPREVAGVLCKFKSRAALIEALEENEELRQALEHILLERIEKGSLQAESVSEEEIEKLQAEDNETDKLALVFDRSN